MPPAQGSVSACWRYCIGGDRLFPIYCLFINNNHWYMNIRQIEVFIAVARHRSFSKAAERLCIAQSAVSIAIRRLEEDLGTRLFYRTKRSVELTPGGQAYLARVQPALSQLELARQEVRAIDAGTHGTLVVAAPAMVTQFVLAEPLVAFQAANPGVLMTLRQDGAEAIGQLVLSGEVELGVVAGGEIGSDLASVELLQLPNVVCVARRSALSRRKRLGWRDVLEQPLVIFPVGYHQRKLIDTQARRRGVVPRIAMETESVPVLLAAVRRGVGIATLPEPAVRGLPSLAAVPLEDDEVLSVVVCYRRDYPLSRPAQALVALLRQAF